MTIRVFAILLGLLAVCLTSCSEERKREAARLERMMSGDTTAEVEPATTPAGQDSSTVALPQTVEPAGMQETLPASGSTPDQPRTESGDAGAIVSQANAEPMTLEQPTDTAPDVNAIPEEAGATKPAMPRRPVGESYTVQVGSGVTIEEAQALVAKLQQDGYDPYIATVTINDRNNYRIRIGRLPTPEEAQLLKNELARKYAIEPWIDKISE